MLLVQRNHFKSLQNFISKESDTRARKPKKLRGPFPLFEAEELAGTGSEARTKCSRVGW